MEERANARVCVVRYLEVSLRSGDASGGWMGGHMSGESGFSAIRRWYEALAGAWGKC